MQTIYLDISNKGVIPCINAKQKEVGRKFLAIVTDGGVPYNIPFDSVVSVWYDGDSGKGNYTDIGEEPAIEVSGNKISVELIEQMLSVPGDGVITVLLNSPTGQQIGLWNIDYRVERVAGLESKKAEEYYNAFSEAAANLAEAAKMFTVDPELKNPGQPADARETGRQISVERSRLDEISKMRGNGQYTYNFNRDTRCTGTITSTGANAVIHLILDEMTIPANDFKRMGVFEFPISFAPLEYELSIFFRNQPGLEIDFLFFEHATNENLCNGVMDIRNLTDEDIDLTATEFYAYYPLANVYIEELADIRIDGKGERYESAGAAVRQQIYSPPSNMSFRNTYRIKNLAPAIHDGDAVNKKQMDEAIASVGGGGGGGSVEGAVRYDIVQSLNEDSQRRAAKNINAFRNGDESILIKGVPILGMTKIINVPGEIGEPDTEVVVPVLWLDSMDYDENGVILTGVRESNEDSSAVNKGQLDRAVGNIENSLDAIIAMQNALIGGAV